MEPTKILLSTLNARYHHCSFGLRYLRANLGELRASSRIVEFVISKDPHEIAEEILAIRPQILGLGVYIWNTQQTLQVVQILKKIAPEIIVVLGGPEISFETEQQELFHLADHVIQGEADFQFRTLCENILSSQESEKLFKAQLPEIKSIVLPYSEYSDEDIRNRTIYVEASRGCPYKCEYCLSSLDVSVRSFDIDLFLAEIQKLLDRGARQFKFVDRTFNLNLSQSLRIMNFFLERIELGLFLHFEMVPDRLPPELMAMIKLFPAGSLQFEIGIQTFNTAVGQNVSRRQNFQKVEENLRFLNQETTVHTHVDLIAGLPGESLQSFAQGFDRLIELKPDEIQVGILKRLKGTPIVRHDEKFQMRYSSFSPFEILSNIDLSFEQVQQLKRFSKVWDTFGNSGVFKSLFDKIKSLAKIETGFSVFDVMWKFSEFVFVQQQRVHGLSLSQQFDLLFDFFKSTELFSVDDLFNILSLEFGRTKHQALPRFMKERGIVLNKNVSYQGQSKNIQHNSRQMAHLN